MGLDRVLVGFGRVLMRLLVVALDVVLACQVMVLCCFFVVLGGFVVCFVCHFDCPVGNLPARSYSSVCEIVVACSRTFTWFAGNSRSKEKAPHFRVGGLFLPRVLTKQRRQRRDRRSRVRLRPGAKSRAYVRRCNGRRQRRQTPHSRCLRCG